MGREDLVLLRRARDTMDRDYAQPLDVMAVARVALMSPGHFSRSFKAAFGETPYSYLMTRRIERTKALLRRGDLSVTEFGFEVRCATFEHIQAAGAEVIQEPMDQPWGPKDCAFRDPAGNVPRFNQLPAQ